MGFCGDDKAVAIQKPRRCAWCGQMIYRGEQAITWTYFDGGRGSLGWHQRYWTWDFAR